MVQIIMTKANLKQKAIELRLQGLDYNSIRKELQVSKGSLSNWLRDLDIKQNLVKIKRESFNKTIASQKTGALIRNKALQVRKIYQEEGRKRALDNNIDHIKACMLYWAEGGKQRNSAILINTDSVMIQFWVNFLRTEFKLKDEEFVLRVNTYNTNKDTSEAFWLALLNLPVSCLRKGSLKINDSLPKHPNGLCCVIVHNTKIVQHIYGAIQQYMNIEGYKWID